MNPNRTSPRGSKQHGACQRESNPRGLLFTILEYVEFTSGAEFRKFRTMPAITRGEIASVDWQALSAALLA